MSSVIGRRRATLPLIAVTVLLGAGAMLTVLAAPASAATGDHFTCRASALRVQGVSGILLNLEPSIANAMNDPCGSEHTAVANVPPPLNTLVSSGSGVINATTTSASDSGSASSEVADLTLLPSSLNLNAQVATASASYTCQAGTPTPQSSSNVVGLNIGSGQPITTSGQFSLPLVGLVDVELNRTIKTSTAITQRAVDITVLNGLYGGAEIVLGEAQAGVSGNPCPSASPPGPSTSPSPNQGGTPSPNQGGSPSPSHGGSPTNTSPPVISVSSVGGQPGSGGTPGAGNGGTPSGGSGGSPGGGQPGIHGIVAVGQRLSCSTGAWAGSPTRFTFQWSRGGTPIVGATGSTYTVRISDEATTLTCIVVAYNGGGASRPATSAPVTVRVPYVPRCPGPSGRLTGTTLGLVRLGMSRAAAHRAYTHSSNRGRRYQDFFCLTPTGVRVGYASNTLRRSMPRRERQAYKDRVVVATTSAAYYSLHGIRPGATLAAARKILGKGNLFHIGLNYWYFARHGNTTWITKVRHGIVEEIGIASPALTRGRKAQRIFITSFWAP